jgi:hypothetical protein
VNTFVEAFHESVLLYALKLNQTLVEGWKITDGATITRNMWKRTVVGITGNVTIDSNGDRKADYSLLDRNPDTGFFRGVGGFLWSERETGGCPRTSVSLACGKERPSLGYAQVRAQRKNALTSLPEFIVTGGMGALVNCVCVCPSCAPSACSSWLRGCRHGSNLLPRGEALQVGGGLGLNDLTRLLERDHLGPKARSNRRKSGKPPKAFPQE